MRAFSCFSLSLLAALSLLTLASAPSAHAGGDLRTRVIECMRKTGLTSDQCLALLQAASECLGGPRKDNNCPKPPVPTPCLFLGPNGVCLPGR